MDYALHLGSHSDLHISAFCDADWAVSNEDRRSVGGFCVFLGNSLVSWSSRRQGVVSRSSTESQYRAIADVAAEVLWLKSLLKEISCPLLHIPVIWSDNLGAGSLAVNPVYHSRMKHVEVDLHFIRDKVAKKAFTVCYVPSFEQIVDSFTKALSSSKFDHFRNKLGVVPLTPSLRGAVKTQ